jgi:hypothetical protein
MGTGFVPLKTTTINIGSTPPTPQLPTSMGAQQQHI